MYPLPPDPTLAWSDIIESFYWLFDTIPTQKSHSWSHLTDRAIQPWLKQSARENTVSRVRLSRDRELELCRETSCRWLAHAAGSFKRLNCLSKVGGVGRHEVQDWRQRWLVLGLSPVEQTLKNSAIPLLNLSHSSRLFNIYFDSNLLSFF